MPTRIILTLHCVIADVAQSPQRTPSGFARALLFSMQGFKKMTQELIRTWPKSCNYNSLILEMQFNFSSDPRGQNAHHSTTHHFLQMTTFIHTPAAD